MRNRHITRPTSRVDAAQFQLEEALARGTYGVVYKGKFNERTVAIKIVKYSTKEERAYAKKEKDILQTMTALNAPHIVTYHAYAIDADSYFIAMEYMNKGTLGACFEKEEPFAWQQRYQIIHDIGKALAFLHSHNIAHGDVKPENILLNEAGETKLCDFGFVHG